MEYQRHIRNLFYLVPLTLFLFNNPVQGQDPVDPSSITNKVVCGYQGWFNCNGDGSPINSWYHWSGNPMPAPGNLSFEVYPDVSFYNSTDLYLTGFANQGDGQPSRLFSSYKPDVVDKHFELMQTHGIDGVALQRFISEVLSSDPNLKINRDAIALNVKNSAETYDRLFYLTYDLSGLDGVSGMTDEERYNALKDDWQNTIVDELELTSSPMYAHQDGKPVLQLWGIGFTHVIGNAALALDLVNWFQSHGCYVIGGVPTYWRTGINDSRPDFANVYLACDMISPWTVGRFSDIPGANSYKTNLLSPDLSYCNTNGMAYMPVVFPGFAWSNWNGGTKNQIPRNKGEFLWQQVENIKSLSIPRVYVAMFDEYDEGTALLSMADGYSMIPTNQYFLTSSADGTYISPDFYLRLAGKATKVIKGIDPVTTSVTIPFSEGPVYFRTSHEEYIDPLPTWTSITENKLNVTAYGSNSGNPACAVVAQNPHRGLREIRVRGRDRSAATSYAYFRVFDVNIPVYSNTHLNFWTYPSNNLSRYVSVDLVMTDGTTTLRDSGALDDEGNSMHPAAGRGTVNTWTKTTSVIGNWLDGKTIDRILIAYDHAGETGDFMTYIDDISIDTGIAGSVCSWTGVSNTDWFDETNWSSGTIPSESTDIYITAGAPNQPVINAAGAVCGNITVNTALTISGAQSLSVYGNWKTHDNLHMPDNSTVIFKGESGKIIDGYTYFYNLIIDKADPAFTLTDEDAIYPKTSFEVRNDLTIACGHLILNGSDWDYFIGKDLIIASTGTLTSNHWFPLHVKGNWMNNGGTYNPGICTVIFDGDTQTIGGATTPLLFNNLVISSTAAAMLNADAAVSGYLNVNDVNAFIISPGKTVTVGQGP